MDETVRATQDPRIGATVHRTRYYAVVLDGANALFASFATADKAEAYDMDRTAEGYDSRTVGEIGGDAYLVIYTKKATKKAKRYNSTTQEEKGPQKATQAHQGAR